MMLEADKQVEAAQSALRTSDAVRVRICVCMCVCECVASCSHFIYARIPLAAGPPPMLPHRFTSRGQDSHAPACFMLPRVTVLLLLLPTRSL